MSVPYWPLIWPEQLVNAALTGAPFEVDKALDQLRELDEDVRLGPSTGSIVEAAAARHSWRRLTKGSLVQFGWGSKQRRIWAAEVDSTSAVAESIAQDKDLCKALAGVGWCTCAHGRPVTDLKTPGKWLP